MKRSYIIKICIFVFAVGVLSSFFHSDITKMKLSTTATPQKNQYETVDRKKAPGISTKGDSDTAAFRSGEILIQFKKDVRSEVRLKMLDKYHLNYVKEVTKGLVLATFEGVSEKRSIEEIINLLEWNEEVVFAEPNFIRQRTGENPIYGSNPELYLQWGIKNTETGLDINAEEAWAITKGSPSVVIGMIDSGIDGTHPDILDNLWENTDEIPGNLQDDDKNGYIDDVTGWNFLTEEPNTEDTFEHGTHLAGIVAAADNDLGILGVAPNVRVAALKVGDDSFDTVDIVEAIEYGERHNFKLFNCSFSSSDFSQAEMNAMKEAQALFICAVGNDGKNIDKYPVYPACYNIENILSVQAVDEYGKVPFFSNYGVKNVDIAAPGVNIHSLILGNDYGMGDGTSMAAPFAAGVAGLVLSENHLLGPLDLKKIIMENAQKMSTLKLKNKSSGFLNAENAVKAASAAEVNRITGIRFLKKDLELPVGNGSRLVLEILPWDSSNQRIFYASSDESVVSVDLNGKVFGKRPGKAVVQGESEDGGFKSTVNIVVPEPIAKVYGEGKRIRIPFQSGFTENSESEFTFIKPDGTLVTIPGKYEFAMDGSTNLFFEWTVDADGLLKSNEIDPIRDYGTWELGKVVIRDEGIPIKQYYNEKYYRSTEMSENIYMDQYRFRVEDPRKEGSERISIRGNGLLA